MKPATLGQWLAYLEQLHPQAIALGLERVERVRHALGLVPSCPVITVGGTNGKGSCCAILEAILLHAGYRVGCYTSPHLLRYNERVRVAGRAVDYINFYSTCSSTCSNFYFNHVFTKIINVLL